MLEIEPKSETIEGEAVVSLTPPTVDIGDELEDDNGLTLTKEVAITIMTKVASMLENADLTIADMKDLTTMHKSVGDYYNKLGANSGGSKAGLAGFISRMKV